ncbi:MAG: hypothetical protein JSR72_13565 [Proteobacteria bacterium]|nr:hypothetical protein [Pseudomonadota bacterium]
MTMLMQWSHVHSAHDVETGTFTRKAAKVLKGLAIAAAIAAVTAAIVAIRVYIFVPGLR